MATQANDPFSQTDGPAAPKPVNNGKGAALPSGQDIQDAAAGLVDASSEALKKEASELVGVAKIAAAEASDRIQNQVVRQKQAGAEYVDNLADAMRRAAGEFEAETPIAATYIRKAAAQVEGVAEAVRQGDLRDLLHGAQSFARQQPTAFLGLAVLAGFGAVRFLKASAAPQPDIGAEA